MDVFRSAASGDLAGVAECLQAGAAIDARDRNGSTALLRAVDAGKHAAIRFLLSRKANPNVTDKYRQTPLMIAAGRNDTVSVQLLIEARTDLRIRAVSGLTALGFALDNGSNEAAALIRRAGGR